MKFQYLVILCILTSNSFAQPDRWQQAVKYEMNIDFNIKKHQYTGKQILTYTNNSPDTLYKVYYHLYFNAFKPNSVMDERSRWIQDPDGRVGDRISRLKKNEQGFMDVKSLTCNGLPVSFIVEGTILEVKLQSPILPRSSAVLEMEFLGQVPLQIRRCGRFNEEDIEYSMSQWYPKLCNYDYQGWHANPYVGREFYGIWGDFDVKITMPSNYTIGATGLLQNKELIGKGYAPDVVTNEKMLTWHFVATNVHDFVWAADPEYMHTTRICKNGTKLRFFYQPGPKTSENWALLPEIMEEALSYANENFGAYPYPEYAFIQAGDGGMEYPMATLITGHRTLSSLVGVSVHELMHSLYQGVLASNEALYAWMDEGFTSYATSEIMNHLKSKKLLPGKVDENPHAGSMRGYINIALSGKEEPLITHADHFMTNTAYGLAAYSKGAVLLEQLSYIMGHEYFRKALIAYYNTWKFKHPNASDFFRVMEKASDLELDWLQEYYVNSTHTIDYAIMKIDRNKIFIERIGNFPMPIDFTVTTQNNKKLNYHIPLDLMRGEKSYDSKFENFKTLPDWPWTRTVYIATLDVYEKDILKVEIDPSGRLADVNRANNVYPTQNAIIQETK